jgi:hypothetical protein
MTHRNYLARVQKPATNRGEAPSWIGNPFLWGIVVVMIVLGVTLYGVSKTVTDAVNSDASAPRTTGQGSPADQGAPSRIAR